MKTIIATIILTGSALSSCTDTNKPTNVEPADYAETKDRLIQNRENDSLKNDSLKADSARVPTAMPPQPAEENQ